MGKPPSPIYGIWQPMVWLQGTLYLSHPWYFTTHGFDPWYFPKAHCNKVIKRLHALSIKHSRIFNILHFSYSIELLALLDLGAFLSMVWEVSLKEPSLILTPPYDIFTLCFQVYAIHNPYLIVMHFSNLVHYVISSPPLSTSKPPGSYPPRSRSVVSEQVTIPWEWGFEHILESNICNNFQPPFDTLKIYLLFHTLVSILHLEIPSSLQ